MRMKTLYLLLFVITFSIMHDTFISLLHPQENIQTTQYVEGKNTTQHIMDIHEIHSMFHFLAVFSDEYIILDRHAKENIHIYDGSLYNPPYKENALKPPIS